MFKSLGRVGGSVTGVPFGQKHAVPASTQQSCSTFY